MSKGKWSEEQKKAWSEKCKQTKINNKNKTREFFLKSAKNLRKFWDENSWTPERRLKHSIAMKKAVLENTDSYTKNNVSGRVKLYECLDSQNTLTKVKGKWELSVANYLNSHNIKWTNSIEPIKYFWKNKWHLYYPDFLLTDYNILLEVKGYKTDRDTEKWNAIKDNNFFVIGKNEIKNLNMFFSNNLN